MFDFSAVKKIFKVKKPELIENVISLIASFVTAFLFTMNSPLHAWVNSDPGTDSSVFKTVALMMRKGFMPYRDTFDHKGPFMYIINYVGDCISEYRGIWVVEIVFLTVAFWVIYKTARLLCGAWPATIVTFISASLLFPYYQGGNMTEEYAMPLIAMGLYIFCDYFINGKISRCRLIICGLSFCGTLLLRPNMIAVWVVMCLAVLIDSLIKKDLKDLMGFASFFLIGILILGIPVLIWLAVNGALWQCWQDYIVFNGTYTSSEIGMAVFSRKWASFFCFFGTPVFIIAFVSQMYSCVKEKSLFDFSYLAYMILSLIFICLSGRTYEHYGMILIPAVAYPLAKIFRLIGENEPAVWRETVTLLISLYALGSIILPDWVELIEEVPASYENRGELHLPEEVQAVSYVLNELGIGEDEPISVFGNWDEIYVVTGRPHATRYSYQFPISDVSPQIMDDYLVSLAKELPRAIVIEDGYYREEIADFLGKNNYTFIWGEHGNPESDGAMVFYRE